MSYQQQPPYQPQAPQQFQPQPPMGMLHLTIQGSETASGMLLPTVHLNGYRVKVKFGRNDIPVFAGPLHIDVYVQWMLRTGIARLDCTVQPNQVVPVFYAPPNHRFGSPGGIGHSEVQRIGTPYFVAGVIGTIVIVGVLIVLFALRG